MLYARSVLQKYLFRNAFLKDSFWALAGSTFGRGLILAASVLIAKILGSEQYGIYSFFKILLINIGLFANWGLGYTATYVLSKRQNASDRQKVIRQLYIYTSLFAWAVILLAAICYPLWRKIMTVDYSGKVLLLLIVLVFLNSIANTQNGIIAGIKQYRSQAKLYIWNGVFTFSITLIFTFWIGLEGALYALLISQMLFCFQNHKLIQKYLHANNANREEKASEVNEHKLIKLSFPIAMQEMAYSVSKWLLPIIVIRYAGFSQLGVYNASEQFVALILFIPAMLKNVMLSHLSAPADESAESIAGQLKMMLRVNFLATLIPAILIALLSTYIAAFYGSTYRTMPLVLSVLCITSVFAGLTNVYAQYLISLKRNWRLFFYQIFREGTIILLLLLLLNYLPYCTASLSLALSSFCANILLLFLLKYSTQRVMDS